MKIDNFYFVVEDIPSSIDFYTNLLGSKPTNIVENRWADWENENGKIYFGIISKDAVGCKLIKGNNGVLGLYAEDLDQAYKKCLELNVTILYTPENVANSKDHYRCFKISHYDK